eukprot:TRINITY_DN22532_c0_g1_i1.p1 TRINITY_DN22532_c0_g1~~TRINITY_DN22532_c0_g1_i1.p1  ORF type:complete len:644 (-),score=88.22 TRINITY_DN22532_c0_g1_i1:99-2030(-)
MTCYWLFPLSLLAIRLQGARIQTSPEGRTAGHAGVKMLAGVPIYGYDVANAGNSELSSSFAEGAESRGNKTREQEWILVLSDASNAESLIKSLCHGSEGVQCRLLGDPEDGGLPFLEIRANEEALERMLAAHPKVVNFVEPNFPLRLIPDDLPTHPMKARGQLSRIPWGLRAIGAMEERREFRGKGVHIYILDTGVRGTHEEFRRADGSSRVVHTLEVIEDTVKECTTFDTSCAVDRHGHGTHCAGTAGGKHHGVASDATVHAVKVIRDDGTLEMSWVLTALDWIIRKGQRPSVVSMSLQMDGVSVAHQLAIDATVAAGITVVVAAGNSNKDACGVSPANAPSAITVASCTSNQRSDFSNWGTCVSIFAPGSDIESLSHESDHGFKIMSGTSMACPHVAGSAAIFLGDEPSLSPARVREELELRSLKGAIYDVMGSPNIMLSLSNTCRDNHDAEECKVWAGLGECSHNPAWMAANCMLSCGKCEAEGCSEHSQCEAGSYCGSCKQCESVGGVCEPCPTLRGGSCWALEGCAKDADSIDGKCPCADGHDECKMWARLGECNMNPEWMESNCMLSCGKCEPVGQGCSEHSQCEAGRYCGSCDTCQKSVTGNCEGCPTTSGGNCWPLEGCLRDGDSIDGTCPSIKI